MNVFDILREKLEVKKGNCIHNQEKFEKQHINSTALICEAMSKAFESIIELVNQVEKEYNGGWIPCSERLPEDRQRCLTTARIYFVPDHVNEHDNYIGIELNTYSKEFGWLNGNEVISWQPLPEPYKGE